MKKINLILLIIIVNFNLFAQKDSLAFIFNNYGKYDVGFERIYKVDTTRQYPLQYNPKLNNDKTLSNRPMIINVWYPCSKGKLKKGLYSYYLTFNPQDSSWNNFVSRTKEFNYQTIKSNVFRQTILNDTIIEDKLFKDLLNSETSIYVGAPPLNREFPLIIAQPGLGGSIEENALLYEFLSSHGYYVISCSYQSNKGEIMHPDWDLERSLNDVKFLEIFSKTKLSINKNNIHLMGFSFGAQSNFNILIQENNTFKSAIFFDSRFESCYSYDPRGYNHLPKKIIDNNIKLTTPMLFFTNQTSPYLIIDSLMYSERNYIMVKDYKHYDFTSIKEIGYKLISEKMDDVALNTKVNQYSAICEYTLSYLNHYSSENRTSSFHFIKNDGFWHENINKGSSKPEIILDSIASPRQGLFAVEKYGIKSVKKSFPSYKNCFTENMMNEFAYYLISKQNLNLAIDVLLWAIEMSPNSSTLYDSLGETYFLQNNYSQSFIEYTKSLKLDSKNSNAEKMINKLKKM